MSAVNEARGQPAKKAKLSWPLTSEAHLDIRHSPDINSLVECSAPLDL